MRNAEVLRRQCPLCHGPLVDAGHGWAYNGDGPHGHYLDCPTCVVRWIVEMDETAPHDPLIIAGKMP